MSGTKYQICKSIIKYTFFLALSVIFLLIFSLWTTPLYEGWYGCDASFFTMAGRGITKGWVPYVDFFDLKGPYFFFLQALGQFIYNGRTGAFIIQCVALFATLVLINKIIDRFADYINTGKRAFINFLILFFHISTLWGGNTLEEFCLPLILLCMYVILPKRKNKPDENCTEYNIGNNTEAEINDTCAPLEFRPNISAFPAFIIGLCFGIITFSKITVAAPIAGIVTAVIITCIKNKEYKHLILFLLYALCGVLTATVPLFIYFGIHNAIYDMLYSIFIFAFKRSTDWGEKFNLRWELKISGCYFAMIFVLFQIIPKRKKNQNYSFLLLTTFCMAAITAVLLHFGDPFIYYFTTVHPVLIMTFITMFAIYKPFELFKSIRLDIPIVFFFVTLCYFASHSSDTLNTVIYDRENSYYMNYVNQAKEMASLIPRQDRNKVYSFNMDMQWFEINKILPCYTYQINLQFFVALDNSIEDNIIEKLNTDPPKWLVIGGDLSTYLPNINDVVMIEYTDVYDNDFGSLYLHTLSPGSH